METKVCTYSEKNARLQLLRVVNDAGITTFELRLNRKTLDIFHHDLAFEARVVFLHCVHELCVNRTTHILSKMT